MARSRADFRFAARAAAAGALALAAWSATPAHAFDAAEPAPECAEGALDALSARSCRVRALTATETELSGVLDAMRASARAMESVDKRRAALANIDAAHNAWRLLRDHDCNLTVTLAPASVDPADAQINCAISRTRARIALLADMLAESPMADGIETTLAAPTASLAAADVEQFAADPDAERFGDWRATCRPNGVCIAYTLAKSAAPEDEASETAGDMLRLERRNRDADWSIHLTAAEPTDPESDVRVEIDRLAPIVFQPGEGVVAGPAARDLSFRAPLKTARLYEGLQAGLELTARYPAASGEGHAAVFSLRGVSSALAWIERRQPSTDDVADSG